MQADRIELPNVSIQMTRTNSESRGDPFVIRLRDHDSGVTIGELELDAEGCANLMSGRMAYTTEAKLCPEAQYAYIGRQRTVTSERPPEHVYGRSSPEDVALQMLRPWAEGRRQEVGADTVRVDRDKGGWKLTFHTYAPREEG